MESWRRTELDPDVQSCRKNQEVNFAKCHSGPLWTRALLALLFCPAHTQRIRIRVLVTFLCIIIGKLSHHANQRRQNTCMIHHMERISKLPKNHLYFSHLFLGSLMIKIPFAELEICSKTPLALRERRSLDWKIKLTWCMADVISFKADLALVGQWGDWCWRGDRDSWETWGRCLEELGKQQPRFMLDKTAEAKSWSGHGFRGWDSPEFLEGLVPVFFFHTQRVWILDQFYQ